MVLRVMPWVCTFNRINNSKYSSQKKALPHVWLMLPGWAIWVFAYNKDNTMMIFRIKDLFKAMGWLQAAGYCTLEEEALQCEAKAKEHWNIFLKGKS